MGRTKKQTLVSQVDFAEVVGVTKQRVNQAIKHGKLDGALVEAGRGHKIDLEKGLELWDENLTPAQQIGFEGSFLILI